ncbi:hypothetical protein QYF50_18805 [Paenibacillus vini]|uniref:hypothetical protein n=1 Tax=Paenibacillus vini TaxID=1476024 RepID=UPI0025B728D8|nr:hypothetical protein [Paenibacillus vini]MDN4069956.1 hypothetical protein [Paenibacillus vini]
MTKQVRDWNKDKEFMNKKAPLSYNDLGVICYEIAPYWHEEAAAEKERGDKAEELLKDALGCMVMFAGINEHTQRIAAGMASLYPKEEEAK